MESAEFTEYFLTHRDNLFRFAKSILGNRHDAEDITQDIYEKFWTKCSELDRYENLQNVLMRSVRNLCYDRIKITKRRKVIDSAIALFSRQTQDAAEMDDMSAIVERIINSLPEKQREAIHLRDVEHMEFSQIAAIMDMEQNAVKVSVCRARCTVRDKMKKIMNYGL